MFVLSVVDPTLLCATLFVLPVVPMAFSAVVNALVRPLISYFGVELTTNFGVSLDLAG